MKTKATIALIAGAAAAAAVAGFVAGVTATDGTPHDADDEPALAVDEVGKSPENAAPREPERDDSVVPERRRVGNAPPEEPGSQGVGIRPDEVEFVREALRAERARRAASDVSPETGGMELLHRAFELGADVAHVLHDPEAAAARVRTGVGGEHMFVATGEVTDVSLADAPGGATVFAFGPGRFRVDVERLMRTLHAAGLPEIEIRGAGIDATSLDLRGRELLVAGDLENLRVRDVTLVQGERPGLLLDVRGRAAVALSNVRFEGWPSGGYSAPIGLSGQVYLTARGCEFLAGPDDGVQAFAVRGKSLAVFEDCTFRDMQRVMSGSGDVSTGSVVRFVGCAFVRTSVTGREPGFPVVIRGGAARLGDESMSDEQRRERFGLQFTESADGLVLSAAAPRSTVADVLTLLGGYAPGGDARIVGVVLEGVDREERPIYGVGVKDASGVRGTRVRVADGRVEVVAESVRYRGRSEEASDLLPLLRLLRDAGLPAEAPLEELSYGSAHVNGESKVILKIRTTGFPILLDARTGENLLPTR